MVLHVDDDIYNEQVKVAEEKGTKKPAVIPVLEVTESGPCLRSDRRQDHRQGLRLADVLVASSSEGATFSLFSAQY